jgi:hypothetical protein
MTMSTPLHGVPKPWLLAPHRAWARPLSSAWRVTNMTWCWWRDRLEALSQRLQAEHGVSAEALTAYLTDPNISSLRSR